MKQPLDTITLVGAPLNALEGSYDLSNQIPISVNRIPFSYLKYPCVPPFYYLGFNWEKGGVGFFSARSHSQLNGCGINTPLAR